MKYEFRSISRIVLPMFIVFLCAAMVMSLGFMLDGRVFHLTQSAENEVIAILFGLAEGLIGLGVFLLLVVINIAVYVMIVYRFYVSFFTDEGYLTFTLPLTVDCHLMIKLVSMLLWNVLTLIVTFIGCLIIFGGVSVGYTDAMKGIMPEIKYVFEMMWESFKMGFGGAQIWLWIISLIFAVALQSFLLYFSIALGCMIFKKNRLLGAILSIFCIDGIYSFISSFGSSLLMTFGLISQTAFAIASVIGIVLSIVVMIGLYCAMKYILERKLNLD
jgi:hypothetical protein